MSEQTELSKREQPSDQTPKVIPKWREVAAHDQALKAESQSPDHTSTSQLMLEKMRTSVQAAGWRGAQIESISTPFAEGEGWRAFTLSEEHVAEREGERKAKMEERSQKRFKKAEAARASWGKRRRPNDRSGSLPSERPSYNRRVQRRSSSDQQSSEFISNPTSSISKVDLIDEANSTGSNSAGSDSAEKSQVTKKADYHQRGRKKKEKQRPPIDGEWIKNAGLRYLGRFNASEQHFRSVLQNKIRKVDTRITEDPAIHQQWIEAAVDFAKLYGGLDDERFAMGLARSLKHRGLAKRAARQKMKQKKIKEEYINSALEQNYSQTESEAIDPNLYAAARAAKKKRIGPWGAGHIDYPTFQKQLAKLARRGFSYNIAQKILKASLEEAEEWLLVGDT